jgi:hypothetical protein
MKKARRAIRLGYLILDFFGESGARVHELPAVLSRDLFDARGVFEDEELRLLVPRAFCDRCDHFGNREEFMRIERLNSRGIMCAIDEPDMIGIFRLDFFGVRSAIRNDEIIAKGIRTRFHAERPFDIPRYIYDRRQFHASVL